LAGSPNNKCVKHKSLALPDKTPYFETELWLLETGTLIYVLAIPYTPDIAAGNLTLPPPSLPIAIGTNPVATATADPLELPPVR